MSKILTTKNEDAPITEPQVPKTNRIVIIANKSWEAAPLMAVLLEENAIPTVLPLPSNVLRDLPKNTEKSLPDVQLPKPRATYSLRLAVKNGKTAADPKTTKFIHKDADYHSKTDGHLVCFSVEVWCIQDWMRPFDENDPAKKSISSSSTREKTRVLGEIHAWNNGQTPAFVVAFGTAGIPSDTSYAGSAVVGGQTFVHDPRAGDNDSANWHDPRTETIYPADDDVVAFFGKQPFGDIQANAESRFVVPPLNPARPPVIMAAANYVSVGEINITNYDDYAWSDPEAIQAYRKAAEKVFAKKAEGCTTTMDTWKKQSPGAIGSVETTHGVIRLHFEGSPFLFVTAVTDRVGSFNAEVNPRSYAQNFACAHNAGITLAWLTPKLLQFIAEQQTPFV